MAKKSDAPQKEIVVNSHHDFRGHMREIVNRLNSQPDVARLVLVNPIYALEDIGVKLSKEMRDHLIQTFHSPPAKKKRMAELEGEIQGELGKLPGKWRIPSTPKERADVVFRALQVPRHPDDPEDHLERERMIAYVHRHPLIPKLIEYERVSRSGLVFFPRATYNSYKRGELKQQWVNDIRFGPPPKA